MADDRCEVYRDGDTPLRRRAREAMERNRRLIDADAVPHRKDGIDTSRTRRGYIPPPSGKIQD